MSARATHRSPSLPLPGLRWRGFTLQVFLLIFLPLTLLLVVIALGSQSLHHNAMRAMVGDRDLRAVRAAANSLSEEISHRASLLQILARQPGQALPGSLPEEFPGGLILLDPDNELYAVTPGSPLSTITPAQLHSILPPEGIFSTPFTLPGGSEQWVLAVTPRADGSRLAGAFSPAVLVREAVRGAVDPAQTTIRLVAPGEVILYQGGPQSSSDHSGLSSALNGESGIDYHHTADGEHVIAFSPVPPLGWGLVLEESWESIASPALNTTQWVPLVLAPLLLLALIALWFGARQVIQPLQALQAGTSELARGNFNAVEHPVGGITEIRLLQNDLVEMARALESAQESLRGYIGAITAGVENERRSLARELHDDTLQSLIALQQRIQLANRGSSGPDPALEEAHRQVQQAIQNLRQIVRGLRPIYLEDLGLSAALEMLVQEIARASGIEIVFHLDGPERRLPPERELALYRIAQEALNNVVRHSGASRARVELDYQPARVQLTVSDDGRGFRLPASPSEFAAQGHFGLLGISERAELAGARLNIWSQPAQGTRIQVEITSQEESTTPA